MSASSATRVAKSAFGVLASNLPPVVFTSTAIIFWSPLRKKSSLPSRLQTGKLRWIRKSLNVDLDPPCLVRSVGDPMDVRRELAFMLLELCMQIRKSLTIPK